MVKEKRLGIYMDHSNAHLMEFSTEDMENVVIDSKFTNEEKKESLSKSEHVMHNKEQHEQADFYKKLGEKIRNYEQVLLFGPTNAKNELFNTLSSDHLFEKIKISVENSDKMSETQQQDFVRKHFLKHRDV